MAEGTVVQPPVPREAAGIENVLSGRGRRVRRLIADVGATVAVAFFTGNTQHVLAGVPHPAAILKQHERRRVTLQTSGYDESSKVDLAIRVARAVYPLSDCRQIGSRQFEQEPASPVEVGLASPTRSDDQVDGLCARRPPERDYAGLLKGAVATLHLQGDALRCSVRQPI